MRIIKFIICCIRGHVFTTPSIINFMDSSNWLKKCDRCGCYFGHSKIHGCVPFSKRKAFESKREFEKMFPYSVKEKEDERDSV